MSRKIKRNEPCPCGSGKKYKKCHYLIKNEKEQELVNTNHELNLARLEMALRKNKQKDKY